MHLDWCKTGEKSLKIQLLSGRNWFLNMLECSCDSEMNYRNEPFPKKWTRKMRKKQNEANRSE